jgi:hypothetical protein
MGGHLLLIEFCICVLIITTSCILRSSCDVQKTFFSHSSLSILPPTSRKDLCLNLRLKDILESHSISSKLADTLPQLLNCHLVLVEVEAEIGFVIDVCLLLEVEGAGCRSVELLGNGVAGAHELFEEIGLVLSVWGPEMVRETYGDGQVIAAGQLCDLTNASE